MPETEYITSAEAKALLDQPLGHASATFLTQAIRDASDEIDKYLPKNGYKDDIPVTGTLLSDDFKIAVAYWTAGCMYWAHGEPERGKMFKKEAKAKMDMWLATTDFTEEKEATVSAPSVLQYSTKGDIKKTDLTDPLNLSEGDA